jgi:opacity protein-like surface antigen
MLKNISKKILFFISIVSLVDASIVTNDQLLEDSYIIKIGIYSNQTHIDKLKQKFIDDQLYIKPYKNNSQAIYIVNLIDKKDAKLRLKSVRKSVKDAYIAKVTAREFRDELVKVDTYDTNVTIEAETNSTQIPQQEISIPKSVIKEDIKLVAEHKVKVSEKKALFRSGLIDDFFLKIGLGYSKFDIDNNVNKDIVVEKATDDTSLIYEVGLGYKINKNFFTTLMYVKNELELVHLSNITANINYMYPMKYIQPYIGLSAGYSSFRWASSPVVGVLDEDKKQTKLTYGFQTGIECELIKEVSIYLNYQYLKLNHKAVIDKVSEIEHKSQSNISTGVRYNF